MQPSAARDNPAASFEATRRRLWNIAYRMLGSAAEADDIVQDTYLRWQKADRTQITNPQAWLVRTCTRIAIDALRAAKRARTDYVGPWLPEPMAGPEAEIELADTLSMAFLLMLERLSPAERAALILRDVFDYDYARIAGILDRREPACRQLVARARKSARAEGRRFEADSNAGERLLDEFLLAIKTGELEPLEELLSGDAEIWADGGGKVLAAMNVVRGQNRVARFLAGLWRKNWVRGSIERTKINGLPGLALIDGDHVYAVISLSTDTDGHIAQILVMRNPDKLTAYNGA